MRRRSERTGAAALATICALAMLGLGGCQHKKTAIAPLPPVQTPVSLEKVPPPENQPLLETTQTKLPPVPVASAAAKPKREKKRTKTTVSTSVPAEVPPVQLASATPPGASAPATAIGALTAEGGSSPQTLQDARELLLSIEKRLNALPAQKLEEQKGQVNKVKNFWRDANAALNSGDGEGAMTLATKAKLLMDDLEK